VSLASDPSGETAITTELVPVDGSAPLHVPIVVEVIDVAQRGQTARLARGARAAALGDAAGFRSAPLLVVAGSQPHRKVLVGRWHIWLHCDRILIDAVIELMADEGSKWQRASMRSEELAGVMHTQFQPRAIHHLADQQQLLTSLAKEASEQSRETVAVLRSMRLDLHDRVAASMGSDDGESPSTTIPLLISLGIAVTQAQHEARDAIREGLWLWRDDSAAYHAYRRSRDKTIINEHHPADANTRTWMRTHDAAIRQCEAMSELLGEEIQALTHTVQSAGVMAQIRDAESADTLNKVAGAAAVGIGLPSLGLAYYGADKLLALDMIGVVAVLAVIVVPTLLAVAASMIVSRGRREYAASGIGVLIGCLLLCLILPTIVSKMLNLAG
jgi:hypothetical protein